MLDASLLSAASSSPILCIWAMPADARMAVRRPRCSTICSGAWCRAASSCSSRSSASDSDLFAGTPIPCRNAALADARSAIQVRTVPSSGRPARRRASSSQPTPAGFAAIDSRRAGALRLDRTELVILDLIERSVSEGNVRAGAGHSCLLGLHARRDKRGCIAPRRKSTARSAPHIRARGPPCKSPPSCRPPEARLPWPFERRSGRVPGSAEPVRGDVP